MLFGFELGFEAGEVARILFLDGVSPFFEGRVAAIELEQSALAQPKRCRRNAFEEAAIVADDEASAALAGDSPLQLFDGGGWAVSIGGRARAFSVEDGRERTLPVAFADVERQRGVPRLGFFYRSGNAVPR